MAPGSSQASTIAVESDSGSEASFHGFSGDDDGLFLPLAYWASFANVCLADAPVMSQASPLAIRVIAISSSEEVAEDGADNESEDS